MTREEIVDIIRAELGKQLQAILIGKAKDADEDGREGIESMYPGAPTIETRPVMHPYGLKSRARDGTTNVVAVQGSHAANRIILGHRDDEAPAVENKGDVALYDAHGNVMMLRDEAPYIDTGDRDFSVGGKDLPDSKLAAIAQLCKNELQKLATKMDVNTAIFNAMILPSGMGPVGPPPVSMQNADTVEDVKAEKVRVK